MKKYFGTDGIRRIANTELTPELVYKVAKAGAYVLAKHNSHTPLVLIGKDTRISGSLIESSMTVEDKGNMRKYFMELKVAGQSPSDVRFFLEEVAPEWEFLLRSQIFHST